jgi:hypothetical protein
MAAKSKLLWMDSTLIVVDDFEAVKAFFIELDFAQGRVRRGCANLTPRPPLHGERGRNTVASKSPRPMERGFRGEVRF